MFTTISFKDSKFCLIRTVLFRCTFIIYKQLPYKGTAPKILVDTSAQIVVQITIYVFSLSLVEP